MTTFSLAQASARAFDVDALVVGVFRSADPASGEGVRLAPGAEDLDAATSGRLASTLDTLGAKGRPEEVTRMPTLGAVTAPLIVAVGLGDAPAPGAPYDPETLRRAAGAAARALAGTRRVGLALPATEAGQVGAVAEGALLGAYAFLRFRAASKVRHEPPVEAFTLLTPLHSDEGARRAAGRAEVVRDAVALVRDLVNTPPSHLHPKELAELAGTAAKEAGLEVQELDEVALREQGYGGITAVGQGSANPPRLVRIAYTCPETSRTVAFVGKGITFDSGGLSLKPSASMDWMKSDMGGAAAVLGAMVAIGRLGPAVNVVGYLPLAENMPSGSAQRPSDVITIYGGRTVEVLNTDAEGRLVLADAIVRACEDDPDLIVDAATLTGAQLVALGTRTSAVMAGDDETREKVVDAARRAGEAVWPMPLAEELRKTLDSSVADIANVAPERAAGMLVAGVFLKEFVPEDVRWAHLDIAGPAFNKGEPFGYTPKGGTGAATRAFIQIAEDVASGAI